MADRATYILMGTYILLFGGLFVCVFGAIVFIVREQTITERPVAAPAEPRSVGISAAIGEAVTGDAPAIATPTGQLIPTA